MTIEVTLGNIEKLLGVIALNTAPAAYAANQPKAPDTVTVIAPVTPIKPARAAKEKPANNPVAPPVIATAPVEEDDDFLGEEPTPAKALTKDDVRAAFVKLQNGRPDGKNQVYAVLKQFGASSLGTLDVAKYVDVVKAVDALLAAK